MKISDKIKRNRKFFKNRNEEEGCCSPGTFCICGSMGILVASMLVLFMVATIIYVVYAFVHATRISNLSGVHVTPLLKSAVNELAGVNASLVDGYEGWLIYRNELFELRYPKDWIVQEQCGEGRILSLKKFNDVSRGGSESLSMIVNFNSSDVPDNLSMKDILEKKGIIWDDSWKQEYLGGKAGIRTHKIKTDSGTSKDTIWWIFNGKIFSIETEYFKIDPQSEEIFDKIVKEFKFI